MTRVVTPHNVTCTPTRLSATGINHAFAFPASFYRARRDERLSRPCWLVTYLDGLPARRLLPIQVLTEPDVY